MTLQKMGSESGAERWEEPDRSAVEYRAPDGAVLRFEAFTSTNFLIQKRIGAKVTTRSSKFQFAAIDSRYWVQAVGQTYAIVTDNDHDANDTYLDEYESKIRVGIGGAFPARVESLCRAQWRGARFRYVVARGPSNLFTVGDVPEFPAGFPEGWPAPGGVSVSPTQLSLTARSAGVAATGTVTVRNKEGTSQQITVHPASGQGFEVDAGRVTLPPDGEARIRVRFRSASAAPKVGSFVVDIPGASRTIALRGSVKSPLPNDP